MPITAPDEDLDAGLDRLEESLGAAAAAQISAADSLHACKHSVLRSGSMVHAVPGVW